MVGCDHTNVYYFTAFASEPDPGMIRLRAASATLPAGRPLLMLTTPRLAHQAIGSVPSLERFWDPKSEEASSFTPEGSLVSDRHPNAAPLCAIKVLVRGALLLLGLEDYIVHSTNTSHPTLGNSTSQPRFTDTECHVVENVFVGERAFR
jgi:hypothetical protein